jgi:hypothetical protein
MLDQPSDIRKSSELCHFRVVIYVFDVWELPVYWSTALSQLSRPLVSHACSILLTQLYKLYSVIFSRFASVYILLLAKHSILVLTCMSSVRTGLQNGCHSSVHMLGWKITITILGVSATRLLLSPLFLGVFVMTGATTTLHPINHYKRKGNQYCLGIDYTTRFQTSPWQLGLKAPIFRLGCIAR